MWKCKHCKKLFADLSTSAKANHSRWCKDNPKRNTWNKEPIGTINKFGNIAKFTVECVTCKEEFNVKEREKSFPKKKQYFCSRSCANSVGGRAKVNKYGRTQYASIAAHYYEQECAVCKYSEVLDVHHIDHNRSNNSPDNLIFLCPNHHALLHRKKDPETVKIIENWGT